ncbi:hypothetical protein [Hymenobacter cellulosilyticus]|uniref:Uncharacterized protein n=1 Tax=Hymenobacter cellulosilyticus TaxID=2932248 RepID=A0A8T9Q6H0_9BACT|nr:hypothetical protein [Hymenobacter cellulosilyticus]UOQ71380.1 hypothetical protein MUN79_22575 [Hymenobacter cellulosilyticus]
MTDSNSEKIQAFVADNQLDKAIALAERVITKNRITDFAPAVGKSLLPLTDSLVSYLDAFFAKAAQELDVKALYAEMNGFTINYDRWFVDVFAFDRDEGLEDPDWLADYNYANHSVPEEGFTITGLEEIQAVYEDYTDNEKWENARAETAAEDAAVLIVLRLQELFKAAKETAHARQLAWAAMPLYVTAHDHYLGAIYVAA